MFAPSSGRKSPNLSYFPSLLKLFFRFNFGFELIYPLSRPRTHSFTSPDTSRRRYLQRNIQTIHHSSTLSSNNQRLALNTSSHVLSPGYLLPTLLSKKPSAFAFSPYLAARVVANERISGTMTSRRTSQRSNANAAFSITAARIKIPFNSGAGTRKNGFVSFIDFLERGRGKRDDNGKSFPLLSKRRRDLPSSNFADADVNYDRHFFYSS